MIMYVLDNNIFSRSFNNLSFNVFPDIWNPWENYMQSGKITSVDEVYCELDRRYGDKDASGQWLKKYRYSFTKPTNQEGKIIAEIYQSNKFREGVKEVSIRNGTPEADAMLVAKAKIIGGIIVTAESDDKPNSEKIPNICVSHSVPYMKIDEFYRMLKNVYASNTESKNVLIQYKLMMPVPLIEEELNAWIHAHANC